jgi:8-hydroxy-5-deazaflavin:NADPH oxidoreductase
LNVGIIGAGHIGGNCARQAVKGGHDVMLSFARNTPALDALAAELGDRARTGSPADAVAFGDVVIVSVPWRAIDEALTQAGDLTGKVVVDTTNQFGGGPGPEPGRTAAAFNAQRMMGARYTKSFNTLTAGFQAAAADRPADERVVQWLCGDDADAKGIVASLIVDMGYVPVDFGGTTTCSVMESPRRTGAVYGEEYRAADVQPVLDAIAAGRAIPPPPTYG